MSRVFQIIYKKNVFQINNERTNFKLEHWIVYNKKNAIELNEAYTLY